MAGWSMMCCMGHRGMRLVVRAGGVIGQRGMRGREQRLVSVTSRPWTARRGYRGWRKPALAGIIGGRRACTVSTISALSMPCR
jgi:hypothetical protein